MVSKKSILNLNTECLATINETVRPTVYFYYGCLSTNNSMINSKACAKIIQIENTHLAYKLK